MKGTFYLIWDVISSLLMTWMLLGIIEKEITDGMYAFLFLLLSVFFIFVFQIIDFVKDWYKINKDKVS